MVAIVSKAVYQRDMPKARVGEVVPLAEYLSTNAALNKLKGGGRLFLFTVRPPGESLWLVAVLNNPRFEGTKWVADQNTTPVRDISELRPVLKFENGKGLPTEAGKLGMSLQTPRVLTADDAKVLLSASGAVSSPPESKKRINLTQHSSSSKEPCLCSRCLPKAPSSFELQGQTFLRRSVVVKHRELHFWAPEAIADSPAMAKSVQSAMRRVKERTRRAPAAPPPSPPPRPVPPTVRPAGKGVVGFLKGLVGK
jgi:hypothetical protein